MLQVLATTEVGKSVGDLGSKVRHIYYISRVGHMFGPPGLDPGLWLWLAVG